MLDIAHHESNTVWWCCVIGITSLADLLKFFFDEKKQFPVNTQTHSKFFLI